jgi:hypothetical protein
MSAIADDELSKMPMEPIQEEDFVRNVSFIDKQRSASRLTPPEAQPQDAQPDRPRAAELFERKRASPPELWHCLEDHRAVGVSVMSS